MNRPGQRRRRPARRLNNNGPREGHFVRSVPMDPPPTFKGGWKAIRLGFGLGSTDVTLTLKTIKDTLTAQDIPALAVKVYKIGVWVVPGAAAGQAKPEVILNVNDPVTGAPLGSREDTGLLSRAARVEYAYSQAVREHSLTLPASGIGANLCRISASAATGTAQISLAYYI